MLLSPPWIVAAQASGRLDPWPVLDNIGGPEAFGRASFAELLRAGLPLDLVARVSSTQPMELGCAVLYARGAGYPPSLEGVPYAPALLFVEGDPGILAEPMVAIVGSRSTTPYGRRMAATLARAVTAVGGVVVSGMARGIDQAAHQASLENGRTIGVLGFGLNTFTSIDQLRLRREIKAAGGAVISEFLPEHPPQKHTFLQRNRVIAGLGRVTVVIEAGHRSGALSTARHALAAGREVLALPGPVGEGNSEGCLDLIHDGATIVRGVSTVLEAARLLSVRGAPRDPARATDGKACLLDMLQTGVTIEDLAMRTGLTLRELLVELSRLETDGLIIRMPGQRFLAIDALSR